MSSTPDPNQQRNAEKRTDLAPRPNGATGRNEIVAQPSQPPAQLPRGSSVLDHAFNSLPVEKQHELMETALKEKIKIEANSAEAEQAYRNFATESAQSVDHVRELGRTGMDVSGTYEGRTASGKWQVEVKKSNYTVIMVVAAIIGIVLLIVALRR